MPIGYSLVSRGEVVLAEYNALSGNASTVARKLLEKIANSDEGRASYTQDDHVFHILRHEGLTLMCMADAALGRRVPYAFLDDVCLRFERIYGAQAQTALPYAMNDEFGRILAEQMDYFSTNPNSDAITRVKGEMSEVRQVMVENIDKVLDRGERIALLVDKTNSLKDNTVMFKKHATVLKRALWYKNVKLIVLLGVVLLIVFYFILASVCGGLLLPSCHA
jgi:vesicle-associated membrane protein 7